MESFTPPLWVFLAASAASFQLLRNALARELSTRISTALTSWSRFAFNLPFSAGLVGGLVHAEGWPALDATFFLWCGATAASQLFANLALVAAFRRSSFSRSIALHKLEVVAGALIGVAFFSEYPSALGWLGVIVSTVGVFWLRPHGGGASVGVGRFALDPGAWLALLCAALLALAGFVLKEATAQFALLNPRVGAGRFEAAAHTLFHTTWIEVVALTLAIGWYQSADFRAIPREWRRMLSTGAAGFAGSMCWFWAYSLALVAYVRAVGQIEAVFSVLVSIYIFREAQVRRQIPGIAIVTAGILLVLLG